jgi:hypothetical protein
MKMQVVDYAQYITRRWLIDWKGEEYKINFAEGDIYDDWMIINSEGLELDIESETAQKLIEFCEEQLEKE